MALLRFTERVICHRAVISAARIRFVDAHQHDTHAGGMRALEASTVIKNSTRKKSERTQLKYNRPSRTRKSNPSRLRRD